MNRGCLKSNKYGKCQRVHAVMNCPFKCCCCGRRQCHHCRLSVDSPPDMK